MMNAIIDSSFSSLSHLLNRIFSPLNPQSSILRLTKPPLGAGTTMGGEHGDLPGGLRFSSSSYNNNALVDPTAVPSAVSLAGIDSFGVSEYATIPTSFGDIFVGETFTCYLSCTNDGEFPVTNIIFKVELQTGNKRYPLIDNSKEPIELINPGHCHDYVVKQALTEATSHVLVCSVGYTAHTNEQLHLRKFFRFSVSNPFDIAAEVKAIDNGFLVAAEVTNVAPTSLYLEWVDFVPDAEFFVADLNSLPTPTDQEAQLPLSDLALSAIPLLKPQATRQFLFKLTHKALDSPDLKVRFVGNLAIAWKTLVGCSGVYKTEPIDHISQFKRPILLLVPEPPKRVVLQQPFNLEFKILNRGDRTIIPRVTTVIKSSKAGLVVTGITGKTSHDLDPKGSVTMEVTVLPLEGGLQTLSGLRIQDVTTAKSFDFTNILTVMVEQP